MTTKDEQLTDNTRAWLRESAPEALRIIDAHAADRAALVAQLKAAERYNETYGDALSAAEAQVAELTRERDEARAELASGAAVLAAVAAAVLCDDDPDADPLEPQEHGEDCYLYTDDQFAIAKAELARRAGREPVPLDELNAAESECAALRAEVERKEKFIDVCSDVHNHNVKLKGKLVAAESSLAAAAALTRWEPCQAEPEEDDDGPLFQGFLTDPNGTWVRWEDLTRVLAAQKETT